MTSAEFRLNIFEILRTEARGASPLMVGLTLQIRGRFAFICFERLFHDGSLDSAVPLLIGLHDDLVPFLIQLYDPRGEQEIH